MRWGVCGGACAVACALHFHPTPYPYPRTLHLTIVPPPYTSPPPCITCASCGADDVDVRCRAGHIDTSFRSWAEHAGYKSLLRRMAVKYSASLDLGLLQVPVCVRACVRACVRECSPALNLSGFVSMSLDFSPSRTLPHWLMAGPSKGMVAASRSKAGTPTPTLSPCIHSLRTLRLHSIAHRREHTPARCPACGCRRSRTRSWCRWRGFEQCRRG